jgi:surfeit locus 1 family protein
LHRITRAGLVGGLLVLLVAAVCVRLGFWQLSRLEERRSRNEQFREALALPPVELAGDTLSHLLRRPDDFLYRRAIVVGSSRSEEEVVWRGRSLGGRPGVNVLTPFQTDAGVTVFVNRGWAPAPDAATVDLAALREPAGSPPRGVLIPLPHAPGRAHPLTVDAGGATALSVQVPDRAELAKRFRPPILPLYLQQAPTPGDPRRPVRLPLPDLTDEGSHFGYAVQWFSFAAIALLGFAAVVSARSRSGRD